MENLHTVLKSIAEQVNKLKKVRLAVGGNSVSVDIEWFITGDMIFLCNIYGHAGPCSRYPCLLCRSPPVRLSDIAVDPIGEARTLESMKRAGLSDCGSRFGMKRPPLFDIPVSNIVPSALHIFLGLGNDALQRVEVLAFKEDCRGFVGEALLGEIQRRSDLVKLRRGMERELETKRARATVLQGILEDAETVHTAADAVEKGQIVEATAGEELCTFRCLFVDQRMEQFMGGDDLLWTKCDACGIFGHNAFLAWLTPTT